ncbi:hypothetical protein GCM10010969_11040 [Saccharibacillus kuerlensis]|uniref:Uncharacterized protein n=1 Tax=Saccharibacillus kuerlensis TaxID=459527 RepID=A0ABQ2KX62_9BACL|nr:hypothetical protein GCM10010969_11040 [Saccharibacillus kuerlensis]
MHRIFQVSYAIFFVVALLMLLVLPWPNGTAMYPFLILVICGWGFWYSGKKHKHRSQSISKSSLQSPSKSIPKSKPRRK